jgi:hypothetical protein
LSGIALFTAAIGNLTAQTNSAAHTFKEFTLSRNIAAIRADYADGLKTKSLVYLGNGTDIPDEFSCTDGNCTVSADEVQSLVNKGFLFVTVVPSDAA